MLDDMPKSQSVALTADPEDAIATMIRPPAKRRGRRVSLGGGREKVVRPSALGMLLKPIGIAVGIVLCVYAIVSLGTTFYRSYYRHLDHTAAVHADQSVFDIFFGDKSLPPDAVDLVIKDVDGSLHKVVASKSQADQFVNDTILMLDEERARIKQAAHEDIDRSFALAFQDRDAAISAYADWFFEWKRSYVVLKETISSAITRFLEVGKYDSMNEAIEADVKDYFLRNYKEQVLKPELRDQTVTQGVEQAARHAHDSYRRVIANGDMRLQLFLAQHTSHLEDIPASTPMTNVKLDWDAQKWKAPTYLMEDRAFDGIAGSAPLPPAARSARWRLAPRSTACWRRASGSCRAASRPRSARGLPSPSRGQLPARWSSRWAGRWSARPSASPSAPRSIICRMRPTRRSIARASSRRTRRRSTRPSPPGSRAWRPISTRPSTNGSTTPALRWS